MASPIITKQANTSFTLYLKKKEQDKSPTLKFIFKNGLGKECRCPYSVAKTLLPPTLSQFLPACSGQSLLYPTLTREVRRSCLLILT